MESRPLTRLSLVRVLVVGPSWLERWVLPGFGPLAIASLPVSLESHPLARFSLVLFVEPCRFIDGCFISPGCGPLMIRFVGVSSIDSTLSCSLGDVGYYQTLVLWQRPCLLGAFPTGSTLLSMIASGITRLWSSGSSPCHHWRTHITRFWSFDDTARWSLVH